MQPPESPFPPLRRGGWVVVWWNPQDRDLKEGAARLVQPIFEADSEGWEVWFVQFKGVGDPVERIVRAADQIIGTPTPEELRLFSDLCDRAASHAPGSSQRGKGGAN